MISFFSSYLSKSGHMNLAEYFSLGWRQRSLKMRLPREFGPLICLSCLSWSSTLFFISLSNLADIYPSYSGILWWSYWGTDCDILFWMEGVGTCWLWEMGTPWEENNWWGAQSLHGRQRDLVIELSSSLCSTDVLNFWAHSWLHWIQRLTWSIVAFLVVPSLWLIL